jgi:hypothetical protein
VEPPAAAAAELISAPPPAEPLAAPELIVPMPVEGEL